MEQQNSNTPVHAHHHNEKKERRRVLYYMLGIMVGILVIGFLAGVLDNATSSKPGGNAFIINSQDILVVIASTAPWIVFFFLLCSAWIYLADRLFIKWNKAFNHPGDVSYGKGIIFEIVQDNNAAAAIVLIMPTMSIALALIYIAILNK